MKKYILYSNTVQRRKVVLSQTAKYALRAVAYMAANGNGHPVLSRTISNEMDIPQNFLSKIMHRLVQASYLTSSRGTKGGFRLIKKPQEISLYEIASLFMDFHEYKCCLLGPTTCDGSCKIHSQKTPITSQFMNMLETTTIDQVF
jgi:Rrf2 family protein